MNIKKIKSFHQIIWLLYFSFLGILILLFFVISMGWLGFMPSFPELENPKSNLASEIYSADQKLLGTYYVENRSNVNYNELSKSLVNALIATEDIRFFNHPGIDGKALFRAVYGIVTFNSKGGGSTITQQLAKLLFHERARSFGERALQKLNEWVIAIKLERRYTKEEIITMYFNRFDFLNHAVGIKSAARVYFNTTPDSLTIEQSAMLVGMAKNPSVFNPLTKPDTTLYRRNVVLSQMLKYDYITRKDFDSLKNLPLSLNYQKVDHNLGIATYFREYLRGYLKDWCNSHYKADGKPYDLYKDGLKIHTTINYTMQMYAEQAVAEHLGKELQPIFFKQWKGYKNAPFWRLNEEKINEIMIQAMKRSERYRKLREAKIPLSSIEKIFNTPTQMTIFSWHGEIDTIMTPMDSIRYYKHFLQAGLMSVEPQTGYVRAYVGGINYKHFKYDHVVFGKRQVGSTFKPFLYALAMQEGQWSPCKKVANIPVTFELPDGRKWTPKNSDDSRIGEMVTLKWALANSVNYISAFLMKRYSPLAVIKLVRKMGITSPIDPVPSICLGTPDLSVYEMVGANSTFVNKGVYIEPIFITRIEDKNGNIIESFAPKQNEAMSEETAYLMISLMKGVVEHGTGIRLRYKYKLSTPIAGKTGTTQNQSDGWFMGLTPDLVTGVWVGCEDRSVHFRGIYYGQGASMALPIWALYMQKVYTDTALGISTSDFEKPVNELLIETDCIKYEEQEKNKNKDMLGNDVF